MTSIELTDTEIDCLIGWIGFILDSETIDNQSRVTLESIYAELGA